MTNSNVTAVFVNNFVELAIMQLRIIIVEYGLSIS
jgi:hypothetical protein